MNGYCLNKDTKKWERVGILGKRIHPPCENTYLIQWDLSSKELEEVGRSELFFPDTETIQNEI